MIEQFIDKVWTEVGPVAGILALWLAWALRELKTTQQQCLTERKEAAAEISAIRNTLMKAITGDDP